MADSSGRIRITARVGVDLPDHERFLCIPKGVERAAALGVWTAALCRSRLREKDGWCAYEWLEAYACDEVVARLVEIGLMINEDQGGVRGVRVLRYEEFNELKSEIDARLERTSKKLKREKVRAKRNREAEVRTGVRTSVRAAYAPATPDVRPAYAERTIGRTCGYGNGNGEGTVSSLDLPLGLEGGAGGAESPPPAVSLQGHRDAHEIARVEHCAQPRRRGRAPATLMRRDWQPSADVVAAFACEGIDAAACVPEFLDYWLGEGKPKADWDATFRNRVRPRIEQGRAPMLRRPEYEYDIVIRRGKRTKRSDDGTMLVEMPDLTWSPCDPKTLEPVTNGATHAHTTAAT